MKNTRGRCIERNRLGSCRPIAVLTAAVLGIAAGLPIQAQTVYFSSSGANGSYPVNLFPINGFASSLNFSGNTVGIGNAAPGSFAAMAGGVLTADALDIGGGVAGNGTVTVTGTSTRFDLGGGTVGRLNVGQGGTGSLTVSAGARVDATFNTSGCLANIGFCNSSVGNGAGSTGTLTVTGAGSEVVLLRLLSIGNTNVRTVALDGFDFGTAGGTTNAFVNVLAGGLLRTEQVFVGSGPNSAAATGAEQGFGTVVVEGASSRWLATRNTIDNREAFVTVGQRAGGQGNIEVRNGGLFRIDGPGVALTPDGINLGVLGGRGTLTVTGAGSRFEVVSNNALIQVGRSGAGAEGSFSVLAGATASATLLQIGRDGATGTMLINGVGSQLTLTGTGTAAGDFPAFANIGRDGGLGNATVSGGAQWMITDGGVNSILTGSPGITLGRGTNASGNLLITGPGSVVEVRSTSLGLLAGNPDNMNPFVAVGYDNPGTTSGQLTIANGGKLLLTGNAVSTPADARTTSLNIGGRGADNAAIASTGTVTVTGAGSEIKLSGYDRFIGVGRGAGGSGTLNVLDQALVTTTSMAVGENTIGVVNISNAQLVLTGFRSSIAGLGAGMTVGRGIGGNGVLAISNGGSLVIENNTFATGMSIGGDGFVSGGTGTVALSGASSLTFTGSALGGGLNVGRSGVGVLTVGGASTVDISNLGTIAIGRNPGGSGSLNVSGGSTLSAGTFGIGGASDDVAGGVGSAVVTGAGSSIVASGASGFIGVGHGGTGSLSVAGQGNVSAIVMNVGRAAGGIGNLAVDSATINLSGQQTTGSLTGATLSIGSRGGSGVASVTNGSVVTISNLGSDGARLNIGGTLSNPLGNGILSVTGNSQINIVAAPGQAVARIGHDGNGTASFNASSMRVGSAAAVADGQIIIAGLPGSVGTLSLANGSIVSAGYVGVGSSPGWTEGSPIQTPGGVGKLILNNSTLNATTLEIGAQGVLSGDGGIVNVTGDVILGGTIDPGNSPGRIRINCNLISLAGSQLIIEIAFNGAFYEYDQIIIDAESTYDLKKLNVVLKFVGDTDPNAFAATGGLDLDNFILVGLGDNTSLDEDQGLSTRFGLDSTGSVRTWDDVIDPALVTALSSRFDIAQLVLQDGGGVTLVAVANAVPEPATWALLLAALLGWAGWTRRGRYVAWMRARRGTSQAAAVRG